MDKKVKTNRASQAYWLVKFAPFRTSWNEIVRRGVFTLRGVRSPEARNNLKKMKRHDPVLFYHSQKEFSVVGLMEVTRKAYPDPTSTDTKWLTCDFAPVRSLAFPVKLSALKAEPKLAEIALIRQPRLAVIPLSAEEFEAITKLGNEAT